MEPRHTSGSRSPAQSPRPKLKREVQGDAGDAHGLVLSINLAVLYPRGGQQEGIINSEQRRVVQESEELLESVRVQRPCLACFERNGMSSLLEDLMQVAIAQE